MDTITKESYIKIHDLFVTAKTTGETMKYLLDDINGKPVHEGDVFKFKYVTERTKDYELIGEFKFNEEKLKYDIIVIEDNELNIVTINYIDNGTVFNIERI